MVRTQLLHTRHIHNKKKDTDDEKVIDYNMCAIRLTLGCAGWRCWVDR